MSRFLALSFLLLLAFGGGAHAREDPGREVVGQVAVTLAFGTDRDPEIAGERTTPLDPVIGARLRKAEALKFRHYRQLGRDVQPVLRSYESWAAPMRPSEEVLVRFEIEGMAPEGELRLDLELWLQKQKVLKTSPLLKRNKPLYIRGPEWRGGRMILVIELKS